MLRTSLCIGIAMVAFDTQPHSAKSNAVETYYGYALIEYERPAQSTIRFVSQVRVYCERIGVGSQNPVNIMKLRATIEADALERSGRLYRGTNVRRTVSFHGGSTTFDSAEKSRAFYYDRLRATEYDSKFEDGAGCSND